MAESSCRVFPEDLGALADRAVFMFRPSLGDELERAGCLQDAKLVWSQWAGYLKPPHNKSIAAFTSKHRLTPVLHHSSGHASVGDLSRLVDSISPQRVVPIHSFGGDQFSALFPRVDVQADGAWWEVTP